MLRRRPEIQYLEPMFVDDSGQRVDGQVQFPERLKSEF